MFKTAITKLPILLLAFLACFVTISGPVRVISLAQESESEIADAFEAKEFCQQEQQSRKVRQRQAVYPLWRSQCVDDFRTSLFPATIARPPANARLFSSPPLRAPPA